MVGILALVLLVFEVKGSLGKNNITIISGTAPKRYVRKVNRQLIAQSIPPRS